jgi:hypothetical protein
VKFVGFFAAAAEYESTAAWKSREAYATSPFAKSALPSSGLHPATATEISTPIM